MRGHVEAAACGMMPASESESLDTDWDMHEVCISRIYFFLLFDCVCMYLIGGNPMCETRQCVEPVYGLDFAVNVCVYMESYQP